MLLILTRGAGMIISAMAPEGCVVRPTVGNSFTTLLFLLAGVYMILLAAGLQMLFCEKLSIIPRILCSVCMWALVALASFYMLLCWAFAVSTYEEHIHDNGTLTISETIGLLGDPSYALYEQKGMFYARYLRPADNESDDDVSISAEEYSRQKQEAYEAEQAETFANEESSIEDHMTPGERKEAEAEQERWQLLTDGYQAIYDTLCDDGKTVTVVNGAKSDSTYVEVDKTEDIVRFLVYDRRSENDLCGLYVYYEADLDRNGEYNRSNARILDMYAVSDDGVVVSSERQSWEDVGTEEYRKLTGE